MRPSARRGPLLVFAAVSLLYLLTRSLWLDDWDSVQFARGLADFNLWKHQPHPPGYPLYILAGRLLAGLGFAPTTALVVPACLAGGLFVAVWQMIARDAFGPRVAALLAAALAFAPAVWMTAVKALTDMPAAAVLALQLLSATRSLRAKRAPLAAAAWGALACGFRPQLFPIALAILATALWQLRAPARSWSAAILIFLAGCAIWFGGVCWTQRDAAHGFSAYPQQLLGQWRWRLDKPEVYVGAAEQDAHYWLHRVDKHMGGWFRFGLGLGARGMRTGGRAIALGGLLMLLVAALRGRLARHGSFAAFHKPWAVLHVAIIFCCLPPDSRYYVPVMPFILLALIGGWWSLPGRARWLAAAIPALLACISAPLAWSGHTEPPPPVRLVECVAAQPGHPALITRETLRHAEWYAGTLPFATKVSRLPGPGPYTLYADNPALLPGPSVEIARFARSPIIHLKHSDLRLYSLAAPPPAP